MSDPNQVLRLSDVTKKIPFSCRLIASVVFLVWVGDIFGPVVSTLDNNVSFTWGPSYQIWRIFTSSFCISSLFALFMVAVNCYTFVPKLVILLLFRNLKQPALIYCQSFWSQALLYSFFMLLLYHYCLRVFMGTQPREIFVVYGSTLFSNIVIITTQTRSNYVVFLLFFFQFCSFSRFKFIL